MSQIPATTDQNALASETSSPNTSHHELESITMSSQTSMSQVEAAAELFQIQQAELHRSVEDGTEIIDSLLQAHLVIFDGTTLELTPRVDATSIAAFKHDVDIIRTHLGGIPVRKLE